MTLMAILTISVWEASADFMSEIAQFLVSKNTTHYFPKITFKKNFIQFWNHHEKCMQISTNIPTSIGLVAHEIGFEVHFANNDCTNKTNGRGQCVNVNDMKA